MDTVFSAIIIAIVEGLTEFLPVSSTGHMILVSNWLNFDERIASTFEIFIQLGAILAIVVLYPHRFRALTKNVTQFSDKGEFVGLRALLLLAVGCVPAFVLGFLLHSAIKENLFTSYTVAVGLVIGGLALILIERNVARTKRSPRVDRLEDLSFLDVAFVGVAQCFALWPGVSRSGATIIGAMMIGLSRQVAAEFSFLLAVPVMTAAVSLDLIKSAGNLSFSDIPIFALGFIVAFLVAIIAVKGFVAILNQIGLAPFGLYRIILGLFVIWITLFK